MGRRKFIYLAAVRETAESVEARIIAPTRVGGGKVSLKLCRRDGAAEERMTTKRTVNSSAGRAARTGAMPFYEA